MAVPVTTAAAAAVIRERGFKRTEGTNCGTVTLLIVTGSP